MHNWAGNVVFSTADVRRPGSVEELQHVVRQAASVHTIGTGHSFNDLADTAGTLVSVQGLPTPIEIVESRSTAIVPGGATYAQVAIALHEQGWALHNLGSLPHISVAGACASGTHGSGVGNGCLATAAVGVELVRADGELVEVHDGHPTSPAWCSISARSGSSPASG